MLKIKKLSFLSLVVSAVVSAHGFCKSTRETKFNADSSYVIGYATGQQFLKKMIDDQKDIIHYDNARILEGVKMH